MRLGAVLTLVIFGAALMGGPGKSSHQPGFVNLANYLELTEAQIQLMEKERTSFGFGSQARDSVRQSAIDLLTPDQKARLKTLKKAAEAKKSLKSC